MAVNEMAVPLLYKRERFRIECIGEAFRTVESVKLYAKRVRVCKWTSGQSATVIEGSRGVMRGSRMNFRLFTWMGSGS